MIPVHLIMTALARLAGIRSASGSDFPPGKCTMEILNYLFGITRIGANLEVNFIRMEENRKFSKIPEIGLFCPHCKWGCYGQYYE